MSNNNNNNNRNNNWNGKKQWYGKKPWFRKNWNKNKSNANSNNDNRENNENNNPNDFLGEGGGNGNRNSYKKNNNYFKNQNNFSKNKSNEIDTTNFYDDESSNGLIFNATANSNAIYEDDFANLVEEIPDCPYKMWSLYFPKEVFKEQSEAHQLVEKFLLIIENSDKKFDINDVKSKGFFNIDYRDFANNPVLRESVANFPEDFSERPELYLNAFSLAMHQFIFKKLLDIQEKFKDIQKILDNDEADIVNELYHEFDSFDRRPIPFIKCRMLNYTNRTKIKSLKTSYLNKFVSIIGTVVRVSQRKPYATRHAFECNKCQSTFQCLLTQGMYAFPGRCASKTCNSKLFTPLHDHFMTKVVDWQKIKLQETITDPKDNENGRIPRTVECELMEDLTCSCSAGEQVTINGIVKAISNETSGNGRSGKDKCSYLLYILVNSVQGKVNEDIDENDKDIQDSKSFSNKSSAKDNKKDMDFTDMDLMFFDDLRNDSKNIFKLLVNSICPSIYGHELVKAGLVLSLFGGSENMANDVTVRNDIHTLIVGDPGLGKSQLLRACTCVSPRGIYVCGTGSTTAGLTVSLSKDKDNSDDFALDAGALLCANKGSCCIDEFDKMGNQQQTLLEAMEQQCISIAKGGIVCTLPCKTTVIAAANPCGGHYDKSKTVSENLKLSGPLLSRFDLLFILLDKPDEELDYRLTSHIISLNTFGKKDINSSMHSKTSQLSISTLRSVDIYDETIPLSDRLKLTRDDLEEDETFDPIPPPLLRKYIMYGRRECNPKIGDEAAKILTDFFTNLRQSHKRSNGCNPVTMRQLESLMRLTQARAKVELRSVCTGSDARDVIEIMKSSMVDHYENELSLLELTTAQGKSRPSKSSSIKQFVALLQKKSDEKKEKRFTYDEIKEIYKTAVLKIKSINTNFDDLINKMNSDGFLLMKGSRIYELASANY